MTIKQLDLFITKYSFKHLKDDTVDYDPINKSWHRWVSNKAKHFTRESLLEDQKHQSINPLYWLELNQGNQ
jgi:hypothetical protein